MFVCVLATLYYTGLGRRPVHHVAESSQAGPAINLITGISTGLATPVLPMIAVLVAVVGSFLVTGQSLYGLVITNIGTDFVIAFIMASDAFGPITDNAAGIAEMSGISGQASETLNSLDAVGNTMKAATKGYAMASGTVTSFLIFATYFATATHFRNRHRIAIPNCSIILRCSLAFATNLSDDKCNLRRSFQNGG